MRTIQQRTLSWTWAALVLLVATTQSGYSVEGFLNTWRGIYPNSASDNVVGCATCHRTTDGGDPWNAYGWSIRLAVQSGSSITAAILSVESLDADGEGNSNLTEITVGTLPGWTSGNNNTIYSANGSVSSGNPPVAGVTNLDPVFVTLTVSTPVNGSITGATNGQSFASGQVAALTAVPSPGYFFAGWTGDVPSASATANPLALTMDSAKTVGATFSPIVFYTLNLPTPVNGSITGATNGQSFVSGQVATLTAVPSPGFTFSGWTGDVPPGDVTDNPLALTMNGAKTVTANFYRTTGGVLAYSEALSGDLSGVYGSPTPVPLVLGANAVTAQMGNNGGTGATDGSDADYFVVTVPAGRRLTSITVDTYTFSPADPGSSFGAYVAAATFAGQQAENITGQVLFNASSGHVLDDLAGGSLGPGTYAFWFQETSDNVVDYQLTLTLEPIFFPLSLPTPVNGSITGATHGQTFMIGQEATLTAVPATGFAFAGWSGNVPPGDATDNPLALTMDGAKTVVANFYRDTGGVLAYSEALSGDLSGTFGSPTPVNLSPGANALTAQMGNNGSTGATDGSDADYFVVTVPSGQRLTSITVDTYTFSPADPGKSFGAYVAAPAFAGQQQENIAGQVLFNASSGEVRDDLAGAPLGPGTYAFWFQETSDNVINYQLTLTLQGLNTDTDGDGFTDFEEEQLAAIQSTPRVVGDPVSIDLRGILGGGIYRLTGLPTGTSINADGLISGTILAEPESASGVLALNGEVIPFNLTVLPFPLVGSYEVLVEDGSGLPVGMSRLTITGPGLFSATLQLQGERLRSARGTDTSSPISVDFGGITLEFHLSVGTDLVTGSAGVNDLRGFRLAPPLSLPSLPVTVVFDPNVPGDRTGTPGGTGYATGSLTGHGLLTLRGLLGDARPVTTSLSLSKTNQAVVFAQPYREKTGSFFGGILTIGDLGQPGRGGSADSPQTPGLQWRKLPIATDKGYPSGFGIGTPLGLTGRVSKWVPVATADALALSLGLNQRELHVDYTARTTDELPTLLSLTNQYALVRSAPTNSVPFSGRANGRTGTFGGRLTLAFPANRTSVSGVFLQDDSFGTRIGGGLIIIPTGGGSFQTAGLLLEQ